MQIRRLSGPKETLWSLGRNGKVARSALKEKLLSMGLDEMTRRLVLKEMPWIVGRTRDAILKIFGPDVAFFRVALSAQRD